MPMSQPTLAPPPLPAWFAAGRCDAFAWTLNLDDSRWASDDDVVLLSSVDAAEADALDRILGRHLDHRPSISSSVAHFCETVSLLPGID